MAGHNLKCYHDIIFMRSVMMICIHAWYINFFCPAVRHSLKFIFTASSGLPDFPEYVSAVMVDGNLVVNCDSSKKILELKYDWVKKLLENDPHQSGLYKGACFGWVQNYFKSEIKHLKQRFNQSEGTVCTVIFHLLLHELFLYQYILFIFFFTRICFSSI